MKNSIPTQRQIYGIHIYYNLALKYVSDSICLVQKRAFRIIVEIQKNIPFYLISSSDLSSLTEMNILIIKGNCSLTVTAHRRDTIDFGL